MVSVLLKPESKRLLLHCLLLLGLTVCIYFPALSHHFVNFDDPEYTFNEVMVTQGLTWDGVYWSFSDYHYFNYHPLTWLSYMLDVELFGVSASAFHSVNLILHFVCAVAVYFVSIVC
ncbi:MAG: hypothetical protein P1V97_34860 [Planctomycetota bacterium]|nr:hypothetical protein [Planctomycetota bacterium]